MMAIELGFTLGGAVAGAGTGFVIWFTDPLGPTTLDESMKVGTWIGTFLGAALGFYVLKQSLISPQEESPDQLLEKLLSSQTPPGSLYNEDTHYVFHPTSMERTRSPGISMTVINYKF